MNGITLVQPRDECKASFCNGRRQPVILQAGEMQIQNFCAVDGPFAWGDPGDLAFIRVPDEGGGIEEVRRADPSCAFTREGFAAGSL